MIDQAHSLALFSVRVAGLALHASSKAMVDGPIFGCGHASVVPEVEAGKYGDTKEIAWTRTGNAASLPVIVNERMSTVLEELQKVQWDTSRPDLAIYGHHGTLTASNQLMLKPRLGMVAKCEAGLGENWLAERHPLISVKTNRIGVSKIFSTPCR